MTMPGTVLTAVMASAPARTTAAAIRAMSGTLGASLTAIGILTTRRTAAVTAAALSTVPAKGVPNSSPTLGQEIFTSSRSGWAWAMVWATSANSATVPAKILAISGTPSGCSRARV